MHELSMNEVEMVAGGILPVTLARPTRGESEPGRILNDIAAAANAFGGWLGSAIYDWTH